MIIHLLVSVVGFIVGYVGSKIINKIKIKKIK